MDGCEFIIMGFSEVKVTKKDEYWDAFRNKRINLVFMFNAHNYQRLN